MTRLFGGVLTGLSALVLASSVGRVAEAAPGDAKAAITELTEVDGDFAYQGEYVGELREAGRRRPQVVGLQVATRGKGKFAGALYAGGLPGVDGDPSSRRELAGELQDDRLVLAGEGLSLICDGRSVLAFDGSGEEIGRLERTTRISPTLGLEPVPGALVLFDGGPTDLLQDARITADGLLAVGASTTIPVRDFRLHLEFRTPYMPKASEQGRGNSGVYIQRRYEVQILDSFGLEGAFNECGALYRQQAPDVNMCLPPLTWQTYDIWFRAARFDASGNKVANARITVVHNGVPVHDQHAIVAKTGAGKPEGPEPLPILLQNHSNPVVFRNIWLVPLAEEAIQPAAPCRIRRVCLPGLRAAARAIGGHRRCR